jgi:hypothetical protein
MSTKSRTQPHRKQQTRQPAAEVDPDAPVWGAAAIGAIINRNERETYYLLERKALRGAKKLGGMWSALPSMLRTQWRDEDGI